MNVSGFWKDIHKVLLTLKERSKLLVSKRNPEKNDPIKELANRLHPANIPLLVSNVEEILSDARRYTLIPEADELPPFQAGQYVSFDFQVGDILTTRAYSLVSAPSSSIDPKNPYIQIIVKRIPSGFVSNYIFENWKKGFKVNGHFPYGEFHLNPLIDSKKLCFIAGGSGLTPFLSILKDIREKKQDYKIDLLYGIKDESQILCKKELEELESKQVKIVYVASDQADFQGEKGFIDAKLIQKYIKGDASYFLCGPTQMINFVIKELASIGVSKRRIHHELLNSGLNLLEEGYPLKEKRTFQCTVHRGSQIDTIQVASDESIATSLEKAGLKIHTVCRSGYCGACRIALIKGKLYVPKRNEGRRAAEKELGYYYACSSYPLSDIEIESNING